VAQDRGDSSLNSAALGNRVSVQTTRCSSHSNSSSENSGRTRPRGGNPAARRSVVQFCQRSATIQRLIPVAAENSRNRKSGPNTETARRNASSRSSAVSMATPGIPGDEAP
jgi:hypothetical protein